MNFYFDESGNFQLPPAGEEVGIVGGVAIPECDQPEVFRQYDEFVKKLPSKAFKNGEPKGRLLNEDSRKAFADLLVDLPGILVCPIMLDLASLVGHPKADAAGGIRRKLLSLLPTFKHESMKQDVDELASDVGAMSSQQVYRLAAWARCIARCIQDSIIHHSGRQYATSWETLRFELDPVEEKHGNREEKVFKTLLPMWVSSWSHNNPFYLIEEIHTLSHPLVKNWDCENGLDVGKMLKRNLLYTQSSLSKGIQIADMTASLVRRAVLGTGSQKLLLSSDLGNYGLMMTRSIGTPENAQGLFCIGPENTEGFDKRYLGLSLAITQARRVMRGG